ncbi:cupin [Streptomyces sp. RB6PN25]|uniref:Cupin n=1 Tax=Streptomyces humicola TaxID=2953240 RepID=A0ABT1Q0H6_9ACTN|nr:cupin [Streptomyces humicola]MCQ4082795.1 cupin [Streptomyces humicola]
MYVITETDERTTRTAAGAMFSLAAPSQGSAELSTWRVEFGANHATPVHPIDREQVWMPIASAFEVTVDNETETVKAGQAVIIPAGATRHLKALEDTQTLVAMVAGGRAMVPGNDEKVALPWAE